MHLYQVALILTIMAIMCEISWASTQCKTIVMDVHMKKCRLGSRAKRDVERLDLLKHEEKLKRKEGPDYFSEMNDDSISFHDVPRKRQSQTNDIAKPMDVINNAAQVYSSSGTGYYDRTSSLIGRSFGWSHYYPSITSRPLIVPFLSTNDDESEECDVRQAFSDDLDLDLNSEELDELYNNIYERLPRASKQEAWKVFLETASKCCQNIDKCLKEAIHIPCLAF